MEKPKISFDTERLYVRSVEETDKDDYMNLRVETSELSQAYQSVPGFRDFEWEGELNSWKDIYMAVFMRTNDKMVASCSFQSYEGDCIELGFDVAEQYRKQGIATELVKGMLRTVRTVFSGKPVMIRTNVTNTACRWVAEKCGGFFSGYEPTLAAKAIARLMESYGNKPTDDEELLKMRQRNAKFIEDNKEGVCVYRFK